MGIVDPHICCNQPISGRVEINQWMINTGKVNTSELVKIFFKNQVNLYV